MRPWPRPCHDGAALDATPMFNALPAAALIALFAGAAVVIWLAGVQLSSATDALSTRYHLGQALGGAILLAVATNLPEIAITVSAALSHALGIAIGNILGGIAIQTLVLVILDARTATPLTSRTTTLEPVLEGVLVIAVLTAAIMGSQAPASLTVLHVTPASALIAVLWVGGVALLGRARSGLPWTLHDADDEKTGAARAERASGRRDTAGKPAKGVIAAQDEKKIARPLLIFAVGAVATLIAGVVLEESGTVLAGRVGLSGVLFGATVLAAATSLPELATGLASVTLGDNELAISDIFGGNAFLPVLFLAADLLSGQAVLSQAQHSDIYLAALGILLTTVYLGGLLFRPRRQVLRLGVDSVAVLVLYALGVAGLFAIASGSG